MTNIVLLIELINLFDPGYRGVSPRYQLEIYAGDRFTLDKNFYNTYVL